MADDEKAAKVFAEFTVCEVMNRIIKGEELPGFLPIADACGPLLDEIQEKIASNRSVLYVSHDAIIMPFIAYLSGIEEINESEIIDYLAGYVVDEWGRTLRAGRMPCLPVPFSGNKDYESRESKNCSYAIRKLRRFAQMKTKIIGENLRNLRIKP